MKRSWQHQFSFIGGQTVTHTYSNMHFMNNITFKAKVVTVVPFEVNFSGQQNVLCTVPRCKQIK